ncbi:MAG: serine O-acetyltransferase [Oscillospiraceae bacterium]|nr:serine O-acetyltransferase [Oscillospiraceae bacterium]
MKHWNYNNLNSPAAQVGLEALGKAIIFAKKAKSTAIQSVEQLKQDARSIRERDPSAHSLAEVLLLYPGLHAVAIHRGANALYKKNLYLSARAVSSAGRFLTGIEIHPGAEIGNKVFIDHGSGVVIGETAIVGDGCTIYQGVTIGGTGKEEGKRHPTIGEGVMIGAGAKVLGGISIGDGAKIAAGAVVLKDVCPGTTAVGVPAKVINCDKDTCKHDQVNIPDPVEQELKNLRERVQELEWQI